MINGWKMSAPAWAFFSTIVITLGGIWIEAIKAKRRAQDAKQVATQVGEQLIEQTAPIANGFAEETKADLAELRRLVLLSLEKQLELRRDVGSLSRRLDTHIESSSRKEVKK